MICRDYIASLRVYGRRNDQSYLTWNSHTTEASPADLDSEIAVILPKWNGIPVLPRGLRYSHAMRPEIRTSSREGRYAPGHGETRMKIVFVFLQQNVYRYGPSFSLINHVLRSVSTKAVYFVTKPRETSSVTLLSNWT